MFGCSGGGLDGEGFGRFVGGWLAMLMMMLVQDIVVEVGNDDEQRRRQSSEIIEFVV